ncbi:hypothetical protein HYFRA_00013834 [Hymenoscyphus fraxineus]|uniref:Uncharacterized protein n=1 Tax=Hymenoscyphus fraxineus TaxID=746836 RepID=A0A9N9PZS1_9HELO|nr:hypothetical protein HYFRA_00013834 [Hymenoscyphus fraxineus]
MRIAAILTTMSYLATSVVAIQWYFEEEGSPYPPGGTISQGKDCTGDVYCGDYIPSAAGSHGFVIPRNGCEQFNVYKDGVYDIVRCNARNTGEPGSVNCCPKGA